MFKHQKEVVIYEIRSGFSSIYLIPLKLLNDLYVMPSSSTALGLNHSLYVRKVGVSSDTSWKTELKTGIKQDLQVLLTQML